MKNLDFIYSKVRKYVDSCSVKETRTTAGEDCILAYP